MPYVCLEICMPQFAHKHFLSKIKPYTCVQEYLHTANASSDKCKASSSQLHPMHSQRAMSSALPENLKVSSKPVRSSKQDC